MLGSRTIMQTQSAQLDGEKLLQDLEIFTGSIANFLQLIKDQIVAFESSKFLQNEVKESRHELKVLYGDYQELNTRLVALLNKQPKKLDKSDMLQLKDLQNSLVLTENRIAVLMTNSRNFLDLKLHQYLTGPTSFFANI